MERIHDGQPSGEKRDQTERQPGVEPWSPSSQPVSHNYHAQFVQQSLWLLGYETRDRGIVVRFPAEEKDLSLLRNIQHSSRGQSSLLCCA